MTLRGPSPAPADAAAFLRALGEGDELAAAGRLDAAAQIYRRLARQAPGDVRPMFALAMIDVRQGRLSRARAGLEAVTAAAPGLPAPWHNLGMVRQQLGDWPGAAAAFARAVALSPDAASARASLAAALTALGRGAEAIEHHRVLARDPAQRGGALSRIALIDPGAIGDGDLADLREALAQGDPAEVELQFALGEVLERRGDDDAAFEAYAAGNRLQRTRLNVAEAAGANTAAARYVMDQVTLAFIAARTGQGDRSAAPIFVVGFPRSGSTLIEQILASHPQVQGLGETGVLPARVARGYPSGAKGWRALAAAYLAAMRERGWDGHSRFVDKTLENYLHVGLIAGLFPDAVILHSVRDPVDTGFACWRQLFTAGNETLYDLADIAAEHRRYRTLMDHWAAVAPGAVIDIAYEALVADPEPQIRALVAAARLPWDPACLNFHARVGAVSTASAAQVRRPIYATSVARWRRHEARLQPLIEGLAASGG